MSRCLWRSSANVYLFRTIGDIVVKHQTVFEASSTKIRRRREINWYISHTARTRTPFPLYSALIKMLRILLFNFIAYTRETISKPAVSSVRGSKRSEIERKKRGNRGLYVSVEQESEVQTLGLPPLLLQMTRQSIRLWPHRGWDPANKKGLVPFFSVLSLYPPYFFLFFSSDSKLLSILRNDEVDWTRKFQYISYQILVEIQSAICR